MTTPTAMSKMGAPDADASCIMKVLCRAIWTRMPTTISAMPHNCRGEREIIQPIIRRISGFIWYSDNTEEIKIWQQDTSFSNVITDKCVLLEWKWNNIEFIIAYEWWNTSLISRGLNFHQRANFSQIKISSICLLKTHSICLFCGVIFWGLVRWTGKLKMRTRTGDRQSKGPREGDEKICPRFFAQVYTMGTPVSCQWGVA